jgi:hypothetical protein
LSWILVFWGLLFARATVIPQAEPGQVDALRELHAKAVHELENGARKDAVVPKSVQQQLELITGVRTKGERGVSWADVLRETEFGLKERSLKVTISVNALPDSCDIQYSPVAGGDALDAGSTPVNFSADPKYYFIYCSCGNKSLTHRLDCTSDREVVFQCITPKPKQRK